MKKIISILLSIALIVCCFSGCGGEKSIDFIYPFTANVNSYDPQVAKTSDEFLIIENTFEGLIRMDDDGTIRKGVADSWDISGDGLIYTFNLKKGIKWDINTKKNDKGEFKDSRLEMLGYEFNPDITAKDFVFALQRACMPETECPLFSSISCIKNASEIHSGKMDYKQLGVQAIDDYTLKITLATADEAFMNTLTTAVAMPCNEEFFNATKGKYGLSTKYTLFNGQFYVAQILETSYLLNANEYYTGEFPAKASELTFKIINDDNKDKTIELIKSGYYDAAFLNGFDSEKVKDSKGITLSPYNDTTWAFILNSHNEVLQSKTIRNSIRYGLTRLDDTGKEYLNNATNLVPESCMLGSQNANEVFGSTVVKQDLDTSIDYWKKGLEIVDKTKVELTVLTTPEMEEYVKRMIQGIQSGIGNIVRDNKGNTVSFTLKVETVSEEKMKNAIVTNQYDIAFYPFKSNSNSTITYLSSFCENNITGFDTTDAKYYIGKAETATSLNDMKHYAREAEVEILSSFCIIPMLHETSYYASAKGVSGVQFHSGTGRVSFVSATRE